MIDMCPRCRIQAPHRPGREHCPRCGGPLRVVDSDLVSAAHTSAPAGPANRPAPTAPRTGGPRSGGIYRERHIRWVARRPPEAIPAPRPPSPVRPAGIPRYLYIPAWGLRDLPVQHDESVDPTRVLQVALISALRGLAVALACSAVAHLIRYIIVVVNRAMPVPGLLQSASLFLLILCGLAALAGYVYATVVFVRWLISLRSEEYRAAGLIEPRRRWQLIVLAAVPLVNVIGAPLLIAEATALRDDLDQARTRRRLKKVWVAWALVNAIAVAAVVTRIVAARSGSIQTAADALVGVIISAAVSAAFAWWLARRIELIFSPADDEKPARRWVVVGG